jgi:predicted Fe-Mo cluster-binding NifX family protein
MTMRVCIPTLDDSGLEAALSEQFGRAPFFTLVETETQAVDVVPNGDLAHEEGDCDPLRSLKTKRIDLVVCQGLGRNAVTQLSEAGIPFLITWKPDIAAVLAAHRAGRLGKIASEEAVKTQPVGDE